MKKLSLMFLFMFTAFSVLLTGCSGSTLKEIRLSEVTHSIFYAPLYVAINNGYFKDAGLDVKLTNAGGSDLAMNALLSNSADVALLGPETAVYVASQGRTDLPTIFGQLTKRDGSFLISKVNEPSFKFEDLKNKHVIAGRTGGSPAMNLQYAIEQAGLNLTTDLTFDLRVSFNNTVAAFKERTDTISYVTAFEPTASALVAEGAGYIIASVGEEVGEVPFTCFMANSSYLTKNPNVAKGFLTAVMRGYNFIINNASSNINAIVNVLKPSFTAFTETDIKNSIQNYARIDAWCSTPVMADSAFTRLKNVMINAKQLASTNTIALNSIVDNTFAQQVMDSL